MVRNSSLVSGRFLRIWRAASKEERPGMPMSISTMSGRRSRALSTASPASAASPTTSKSDSPSSSRRTPWRNSVWSSTNKHLIFAIIHLGELVLGFTKGAPRLLTGQGTARCYATIRINGIGRYRQLHHRSRIRHVYFDASSASFAGAHPHRASQGRNPLFHAGKTEAAPSRNAFLNKTNAVIFHQQLDIVLVSPHLHGDVLGLGMFGHVVQRFLYHPVNRGFRFRPKAAQVVGKFHPGLYPRALAQVLGFFADSGHQAQLLQHQRREPGNHAPQTLNSAVHHCQRLLDLYLGAARAQLPGKDPGGVGSGGPHY